MLPYLAGERDQAVRSKQTCDLQQTVGTEHVSSSSSWALHTYFVPGSARVLLHLAGLVEAAALQTAILTPTW
jgi:hypothetical protein